VQSKFTVPHSGLAGETGGVPPLFRKTRKSEWQLLGTSLATDRVSNCSTFYADWPSQFQKPKRQRPCRRRRFAREDGRKNGVARRTQRKTHGKDSRNEIQISPRHRTPAPGAIVHHAEPVQHKYVQCAREEVSYRGFVTVFVPPSSEASTQRSLIGFLLGRVPTETARSHSIQNAF